MSRGGHSLLLQGKTGNHCSGEGATSTQRRALQIPPSRYFPSSFAPLRTRSGALVINSAGFQARVGSGADRPPGARLLQDFFFLSTSFPRAATNRKYAVRSVLPRNCLLLGTCRRTKKRTRTKLSPNTFRFQSENYFTKNRKLRTCVSLFSRGLAASTESENRSRNRR